MIDKEKALKVIDDFVASELKRLEVAGDQILQLSKPSDDFIQPLAMRFIERRSEILKTEEYLKGLVYNDMKPKE